MKFSKGKENLWQDKYLVETKPSSYGDDGGKAKISVFIRLLHLSSIELISFLFVLSFQDNCSDFENLLVAQCDALIQAIELRKQQLVEFIRQDKDFKIRSLKDQVSSCTCKLQHTTGLIQFCIEALKETDSAAFLQVILFMTFRFVFRITVVNA